MTLFISFFFILGESLGDHFDRVKPIVELLVDWGSFSALPILLQQNFHTRTAGLFQIVPRYIELDVLIIKNIFILDLLLLGHLPCLLDLFIALMVIGALSKSIYH